MITIRLQSGSARNQLQALARNIEHPRRLLAAAAVAGRRRLQRHFSEKDALGNKLGGNRTHFWVDVRNSTQLGEITDRAANIEIGDSRFAMRLNGGTVVAKTPWPGSGMLLLTIPVHPMAYGRRAAKLRQEFGLKLVFLGNRNGGVIAAVGEGQMQVLYACVPSANIPADPTALPDMNSLEQEMVDAAQADLTAQAQASQPSQ